MTASAKRLSHPSVAAAEGLYPTPWIAPLLSFDVVIVLAATGAGVFLLATRS